MKILVRHPFIALPAKFLARIAMGGIWGMLLSSVEQDVKLAFVAVMAVLVLSLTPFFVGWDRVPLSAARMALYGLLMAGEAMAVGAMVLAALAAFSGRQGLLGPVIGCAFVGSLLPLYAQATMYRDNTQLRRDQR